MTIDRYVLIRPLSEGGAGRVWLAEDREEHGRPVALKRLHTGVDVALLEREFDVLRSLSHPHIAAVLDFGREAGGAPYLVEEYVDGVDFLTATRDLELAGKARLLAQVLRGLEYVHARGVVHGDIKPENVLVSGAPGDMRACILDFGLAGVAGEGTDGIAGTAAYLAPEAICEAPRLPAADLYSFGVMAFEVLVGRRPFTQAGVPALLQAHLDEPAPTPSELAPALPPTADRPLLRLLEKRPDDRPESARQALLELSEAFELGLEQETVETLKGYLRSGRLVGRSAQLRRARALWEGLREATGHPRLHLLWWWGPAASGRSRLIRELSGDALADGARVASASGDEGAPLGVATAWLRGLGSSSDPLRGARDRWEAIERAAADLIAETVAGPILLTLDDVDRVGEMSRDLLRVLLERLASAYAPGASATPPRLAVLVTGIAPPVGFSGVDAGLYEVQSLRPLSEAELGDWLGRLVPGGTLPRTFREGIYRLTGGLPGHCVGLLGAMADRGHLRMSDGALVVEAKALEAPLPSSLMEALAAREARLAPQERDALAVLRALGRPAPASLVAAVLACRAVQPVAAALDRLVSSGLVGLTTQREPRYRAEGAAADPDAATQQALHAQIARALMGFLGGAEARGFGMTAVARHALVAVRLGERRLAAAGYRSALVGASEARDVHAGEEEARLLEWAVELAQTSRERRPVALRLGHLQARLGRFEEATKTLEAVLAAEDVEPDDRDEAALALARIALDRGEYSEAVRLAEAVDPAGASGPLALARAGRGWLMQGGYDRALARCEDGLAKNPGPSALAALLNTRALVHYYTDQPEQALTDWGRAAEAFEDAGDPVGRAAAVNGVGLVHHRRGEFDEALLAYSESRSIAEQSGDRKRLAIAYMNEGTVLHETGRAVEAAERYRESLAVAELVGAPEGLAKAAMNLGNLLIHLNRLSEARYWLERSQAAANQVGNPLLVAYCGALLGKVNHHERDLEGARRQILEAVSSLRELGNMGEAGELLIELGMVARTAGDVDGVEHFAKAVETASAASGADKQQAWVRFLKGEACRLRGDAAGALTDLRGALVLADRDRLFDLGWRCEGSLARAYREAGNAMEARARFNGASARIFAQADGLSGRDRELFLAHVERARLVEEARLALGDVSQALPQAERNHREQLLRLMEINRRLVSERDSARLLEFILDAAIELTGAERGYVLLRAEPVAPGGEAPESVVVDASEGVLEVKAARNIDRESLRKNRSKVSLSITREVIESGEPIMTVDAGEDSRFRESASVHHLRLRSILCFPLRSHGRVVGAIYLDNRFQASTFEDRDLTILSAFGDQAAVAIANALLYERMTRAQAELQASHARVAALNAELRARVDDQAARLQQIESRMALQREQLSTRYSYDNIIGSSVPMQRIFTVLDRVTDTSVPVLIQGESGTGKELVARAVHYNSEQRKARTFVSVNCAALTETLLESELFGHVRGAFTGADRDRRGLFEVASGGTLFLDEVADMSLAMQAKLLRALQEGEIWPVGSHRAIRVDVRIVAACNRDLAEMVSAGEFRQDLYFRLNVVRVQLPPLRERGEDLILLIQHFLRRFADKHGGPVFKLSQAGLERLQRYAWPGNVRELEACLTNAALFCDGDTLQEVHFQHKPELFREPAGRRLNVLSGLDSGSPELGGELMDLGAMSLAQLEKKAILAALERAAGNKVEAARRLGITRQTLYNKLKNYGIEVRRQVRRKP